MKQYEYVGVDISKSKFDVCLKEQGKTKHKVFSNTLEGHQQFLDWLKTHTTTPWVCMEATGHYSEGLADFLTMNEVRVSVANPFTIKSFIRAQLTRNKNDKIDSLSIREYVDRMQPNEYRMRESSQKELRDLTKLRDSLKAQLVRLKNQLDSVQGEVARKLFKKQIEQLEKDIKKLEEQIQNTTQSDEKLSRQVELLCSIDGIGVTTAHQILARMPAVEHFRSAKQFAAFIGITPQENQSGNFSGKASISRFGDRELRKALYMPALVAKRYNEPLAEFSNRLEAKNKPPKVIICAVMRRLAHIIFGVLKSGEPFDAAVLQKGGLTAS